MLVEPPGQRGVRLVSGAGRRVVAPGAGAGGGQRVDQQSPVGDQGLEAGLAGAGEQRVDLAADPLVLGPRAGQSGPGAGELDLGRGAVRGGIVEGGPGAGQAGGQLGLLRGPPGEGGPLGAQRVQRGPQAAASSPSPARASATDRLVTRSRTRASWATRLSSASSRALRAAFSDAADGAPVSGTAFCGWSAEPQTGQQAPTAGTAGDTVEWVALLLVVSIASLAILTAVAGPFGALGLVRAISAQLLCAADLSSSCSANGALVRAYGSEIAATVADNAPEIDYEEGMTELPIDFRSCRSTSCGNGAHAGSIEASDRGEPAAAFVHVVDCRTSRSRAENTPQGYVCSGERAGNLYVQYWLYYPDSSTSPWTHLPGRPGFHADDWEGYQLRIGVDGTDARATSHRAAPAAEARPTGPRMRGSSGPRPGGMRPGASTCREAVTPGTCTSRAPSRWLAAPGPRGGRGRPWPVRSSTAAARRPAPSGSPSPTVARLRAGLPAAICA